MEQVISNNGYGRKDIPNINAVSATSIKNAENLLPTVIEQAKKVLKRHSEDYRNKINPQIDEELDKLAQLEERHKDYQLSLFDNERMKSAKEREVEQIFREFTEWVRDTLEIKDNPHLQVIAVITGVK